MQSAMQMFVARFASKDPRIFATTDTGGLQLRFRMTAKNKTQHHTVFRQLLKTSNR
jgi:hypothetical protein